MPPVFRQQWLFICNKLFFVRRRTQIMHPTLIYIEEYTQQERLGPRPGVRPHPGCGVKSKFPRSETSIFMSPSSVWRVIDSGNFLLKWGGRVACHTEANDNRSRQEQKNQYEPVQIFYVVDFSLFHPIFCFLLPRRTRSPGNTPRSGFGE